VLRVDLESVAIGAEALAKAIDRIFVYGSWTSVVLFILSVVAGLVS
jgi:hypothetical protein